MSATSLSLRAARFIRKKPGDGMRTNKSVNPQSERRAEREGTVVGDYFDQKVRRYFDEVQEYTVVKVFSGECYIADKPGEMMVTILGSCVAACIRDPEMGIGGMNHFLLPGGDSHAEKMAKTDAANRYGSYAMEELINGLLSRGAKRNRLEIKLFGGGNVIDSSAMIGDKNVRFVRQFLRNEGLPIATENLGGDLPRRIHYYPDTGKVMMRTLQRKSDMRIVAEEKKYAEKITKKEVEGDIELF